MDPVTIRRTDAFAPSSGKGSGELASLTQRLLAGGFAFCFDYYERGASDVSVENWVLRRCVFLDEHLVAHYVFSSDHQETVGRCEPAELLIPLLAFHFVLNKFFHDFQGLNGFQSFRLAYSMLNFTQFSARFFQGC